VHSSVSQLINKSGQVRASYGYDAYGGADARPTDGQALTSGDTNDLAPLNPYRYSGRRIDSGTASSGGAASPLPNGSGGYDMGARRYGPDIAGFLQQDMYHGALANLGLALDPLTQNRYALAGGNPISYIETDGHRPTENGDGGGSTSQTPTEDYEAARRAYFTPIPDSDPDERVILTGEHFKAPGNGIIVSRFFVKEKDAAGGILRGDDRGFTTDPSAPFRVAVAWDTERGQVSYTVSASDRQEQFITVPHIDDRFPYVHSRKKVIAPEAHVDALEICDPPCSNSIRAMSSHEGYLNVEVAGLNPVLPCCETNQELWFDVSPGRVRVDIAGDDYPDFEVVQYGRSSPPRMLAKGYAGSWLGGGNSMPWTFPRANAWENGKCVMGFNCMDAY
jgi:RHS repeat-associated protein